MRKKLLLFTAVVMAALVMVLSGCGSSADKGSASGDKKIIKLGVRADGAERAELLRAPLEKMGYTLEITPFEDSILPNVALGEKSIDVNWYQHLPYLESYNKSKGTDFVMVKPYTHYARFGLYSDKYKEVSQIPDGAVIGLCNDTTNRSRGSKMLADLGLITLNPGVDNATIYDIKDNPHHFQFVEAEMTSLAQAINDYGAIALASAHMANAGKDPSAYLAESKDSKDFALGYVVRPEDQNAQWVQDLIKATQTDEMKAYFQEHDKGALVPMW